LTSRGKTRKSKAMNNMHQIMQATKPPSLLPSVSKLLTGPWTVILSPVYHSTPVAMQQRQQRFKSRAPLHVYIPPQSPVVVHECAVQNHIRTATATASAAITMASPPQAAVGLASLADTADGNANPEVLASSARCAPAPAVSPGAAVDVIKNPLESYDLGWSEAAGSTVTMTGKPC
jgi:hypothetical protein